MVYSVSMYLPVVACPCCEHEMVSASPMTRCVCVSVSDFSPQKNSVEILFQQPKLSIQHYLEHYLSLDYCINVCFFSF